MYIAPHADIAVKRTRTIRCSVADLRRLVIREAVWRQALPWLAVERFDAEIPGQVSLEGVVRRGPFRLRVALDGRLRLEGETLAFAVSGRLERVITLSGQVVAYPDARGSRLEGAMRLGRLPPALQSALAAVEHRALGFAVSAIEALAQTPHATGWPTGCEPPTRSPPGRACAPDTPGSATSAPAAWR